jgi:hypothetical protein
MAVFAYALKKEPGGVAMADNLTVKLLIAGVVGAIVGAATADRYHFPAGSVYGFKQTGNRTSQLPANPMIASAKAGEARTDDSIGHPRIMRSASADRPEVGPSGPPQSRGIRPSGYGRAAMCWREYDDPDFGMTGYYVPCVGERRPKPPSSRAWASYPP